MNIDKKIQQLLLKNNLTISVAESCTGGLLSSEITKLAGSSNYYNGGICTYSNEAKINLLGVKRKTIIKYGAVSNETATEMCENVRKKFQTDIGLSTTGVAGPGGGTIEKPTGLVWIGISYDDETISRKYNFKGTRNEVQKQAVETAKKILIDYLKKNYKKKL